MKKYQRMGVAIITFTALLIALSAPAFGHVTVEPESASKGGYETFTFKVPNEDDVESTNKIEIEIPQEAKITYAAVMPIPGWTYEIQKIQSEEKSDDGKSSEIISKVIFQGGLIKPGEFQEFKVSLGKLPEDTDTLTLKSIQTYTDGKEVKWTEESIDGEEPELPAPVVSLVEGSGDHHSSSDSHATDTKVKETSQEDSSDSDLIVYIALGVSILALALGGIALVKKK